MSNFLIFRSHLHPLKSVRSFQGVLHVLLLFLQHLREDMLFLRRAVEHDVLLPLRQLAERHIRAHAHLAADIRHQGPHQAVPRGNRTLVDGQGLIRHKRRHIDGVHHARAAALLARALRVECQLLGRRSIKMHAARRADELLPGRDEQRRGQIMAIRAAVAGKAGIHQPQAV